jgi:hypothetical protein
MSMRLEGKGGGEERAGKMDKKLPGSSELSWVRTFGRGQEGGGQRRRETRKGEGGGERRWMKNYREVWTRQGEDIFLEKDSQERAVRMGRRRRRTGRGDEEGAGDGELGGGGGTGYGLRQETSKEGVVHGTGRARRRNVQRGGRGRKRMKMRGTEMNGLERKGTEKNGKKPKGRNGKWKGKERNGKEGKERNGTD